MAKLLTVLLALIMTFISAGAPTVSIPAEPAEKAVFGSFTLEVPEGMNGQETETAKLSGIRLYSYRDTAGVKAGFTVAFGNVNALYAAAYGDSDAAALAKALLDSAVPELSGEQTLSGERKARVNGIDYDIFELSANGEKAVIFITLLGEECFSVFADDVVDLSPVISGVYTEGFSEQMNGTQTAELNTGSCSLTVEVPMRYWVLSGNVKYYVEEPELLTIVPLEEYLPVLPLTGETGDLPDSGVWAFGSDTENTQLLETWEYLDSWLDEQYEVDSLLADEQDLFSEPTGVYAGVYDPVSGTGIVLREECYEDAEVLQDSWDSILQYNDTVPFTSGLVEGVCYVQEPVFFQGCYQAGGWVFNALLPGNRLITVDYYAGYGLPDFDSVLAALTVSP